MISMLVRNVIGRPKPISRVHGAEDILLLANKPDVEARLPECRSRCASPSVGAARPGSCS